MTRKLTISIDEAVYNGLISVIGRGRIGAFFERLAGPIVLPGGLDDAYASMASDTARELQAFEWTEALLGDVDDAAR